MDYNINSMNYITEMYVIIVRFENLIVGGISLNLTVEMKNYIFSIRKILGIFF